MSSKYAKFKQEEIFLGHRLYNLLETIKRGIKVVGDGTIINRNPLETILHYEIPNMINGNNIKPISKKQVNNTIQALLFLNYIKSSSESYELTSKAKRKIE
ncbi:MAG: hypothetical protein V1815_01015 [Candidatus Woesearchaeota archaeon]